MFHVVCSPGLDSNGLASLLIKHNEEEISVCFQYLLTQPIEIMISVAKFVIAQGIAFGQLTRRIAYSEWYTEGEMLPFSRFFRSSFK